MGLARHVSPAQHVATPPGHVVPAAPHMVARQVPIVQVDPVQHAGMPAPQAMPAGVQAAARQVPPVQARPVQQSAFVAHVCAAVRQVQ